MAITRTQIAKQLLAKGGRIGFRVGTGEGKDTSGRDYGGGVGRSDRDSQYGGGNYDSSQMYQEEIEQILQVEIQLNNFHQRLKK